MAVFDPLEGFGVSVSFVNNNAIVAVRGDVDLVSAPELSGLLDAVMDRGHRHVVLELSELEFLGATGLGVIANAVHRLAPLGGGLTLRSPPNIVRRIVAITGLDKVLRMQEGRPVGDHLGPEQTTIRPKNAVTVDSGTRAPGLRRMTALPADDDVVDGALRLVVALARATVGGAHGVSVSLHRHGRLATVAASDQTILDMDADQYATGEGPCVDASIEGRWFHVESLDQEDRWPAFTPRARQLGINAILSTPLLAQDRPVGALNIYSRANGAFEVKDQELASVFAKEASIILADAGLGLSDEEVGAGLAEALMGRKIIAQAQGVIMERQKLNEEDAYTRLRSLSQKSTRPLRACAEQVVDSTRRRRSAPAPHDADTPWPVS